MKRIYMTILAVLTIMSIQCTNSENVDTAPQNQQDWTNLAIQKIIEIRDYSDSVSDVFYNNLTNGDTASAIVNLDEIDIKYRVRLMELATLFVDSCGIERHFCDSIFDGNAVYEKYRSDSDEACRFVGSLIRARLMGRLSFSI